MAKIAMINQVKIIVALSFTAGHASNCQRTHWSGVICTPSIRKSFSPPRILEYQT